MIFRLFSKSTYKAFLHFSNNLCLNIESKSTVRFLFRGSDGNLKGCFWPFGPRNKRKQKFRKTRTNKIPREFSGRILVKLY